MYHGFLPFSFSDLGLAIFLLVFILGLCDVWPLFMWPLSALLVDRRSNLLVLNLVFFRCFIICKGGSMVCACSHSFFFFFNYKVYLYDFFRLKKNKRAFTGKVWPYIFIHELLAKHLPLHHFFVNCLGSKPYFFHIMKMLCFRFLSL